MVGLCLPNTPYFVVFYFAVLKAGGMVVNYNPLYVERELKQQIVDSGTTVMVVPDLSLIYRKVAAVAAESGLRQDHRLPDGRDPAGRRSGAVLLVAPERARTLP